MAEDIVGGSAKRSAQLLGEHGHEVGRGHRRESQVDRGRRQLLREPAGEQGLARAGRTEQQRGAVAMLQAVAQPAEDGIAAGQRHVRRRGDRLAEGPLLQTEVIFVQGISTRSGASFPHANVSASPRSGIPPASRTSRALRSARSPVMPRW